MLSLRLRTVFSLCLAIGLGLALARASAPLDPLSQQEIRQGFRSGRLLAKPKVTATASDLQAQESARGMTLHREIKAGGAVRVLDFSRGSDVRQFAQKLRATGLYEYVEPDYIRHAHVTPNDPQFTSGAQWDLQNTGQAGGTAGADISAVNAWNTRTTAGSVIVGVIDSGLRTTHEDLVGELWTNPHETAGNGVDDDGNGYVDDVHGINTLASKGTAADADINDDEGHGTAVTSVIAAHGNNGVGMSGVSWQTQIMALKFNDASESATVSNEIVCINYAVANGAKVINISYGSSGYSQTEYNAILAARNAGVIIVASAGNDGASNDTVIEYPASYALENVVAVANTDRTDHLDSSSTYGGLVDLAAPGTDIVVCTKDSDSSYAVETGTSFAAPHVTASLAMLAAQFPTDTYRQLINRLLNSVDQLPVLSGKVTSGGRLNLAKALTSTSNAPFNDKFANASVISGSSTTVRAASIGATTESGEPTLVSNGGASLWWRWTAPSSGLTVVDTTGSTFDTIAAVYTGTAVNSLTQIAMNDNYNGAQTSRLMFTATAGTTYDITVQGKSGATGMVVLSVGLAPSNDNFANATALTGETGKVTGSNLNASKETGEPTLSGDGSTGVGKTVWYKWTAPSSGDFSFSIFTSSFSPIVGVYTGNSVGALSNVQTDTDATTITATANTTYYIAVDGSDSNSGTFTLTYLKGDAVPLGDKVDPSAALTSDGAIVVADDSSDLIYFKDSAHQFNAHVGGSLDVNTPATSGTSTIYVSTTTGLYAYSSSNTVLWSKTYSGVASSPAIATDGTVYIHSDDGVLHALTSAGSEKWTASVPGISYSSPSIGGDGTIYIGSDNNNLYAVNATDGSIRWTFDAAGQIYSSPAIDSDGTIYFGTLSNQFFAVTSSGAQKWAYTAGGNISSSPAIGADGTIYFGCYDDKLYALTSTGVLKWTFATGDQIRGSSPAVAADGTIYIGSYDGNLYGVTSSGTQKSVYTTAAAIRSSPLIDATQGLIFGSDDMREYFIDLGGVGPANSPWPMYKQNARRTSQAVANESAPSIVTVSSATVVAEGGSATLSVSAAGQSPFTYQWYLNGNAIGGATQPTYTITNASNSDVGNYTVVITNAIGSVTSAAIPVSIASPSSVGHIINLSARAVAGAGSKTLIVGFIVGNGIGTKPVLVRGIGPSLGPRGVSNYLDDPALKVFSGSTQIASNDDWGTDANVPTASSLVGAVGLTSSKDSALVLTTSTGGYTAQVTAGANSTNPSGVALAEFYDASPTYTSNTPTLINISARAQVGTGSQVLIVGFIIGGTTPVKVLIRGLGPELTNQAVTGVIADPTLRLVNQADGSTIQTNDNWGDAPNLSDIQAASTQVGAIALTPGSKDAVILTTLAPGGYTAVLSGVNGATGVGLAELFQVF